MTISNLAYIGLGVTDVPAWSRLAIEVFGMQPAPPGGDGAPRLRLDQRAWRIALHSAPANDVVYLGFEVSDARIAAQAAGRLEAHGAATHAMSPVECRTREISGGIRVKDPDGLDIELVWGLPMATTPFVSSADVSFVTGDVGLGHLVVSTTDIERGRAFYGLLGFELSDHINVSLLLGVDANVAFLHCNARHHTLALVPAPMPRRLDHLMVEVGSVDEVLAAYYRAQKSHVPIVRHMGRHINDHMLSFYVRTPAGFDVEYGCGGRHIGPQWKPAQYDRISIWGHEAS